MNSSRKQEIMYVEEMQEKYAFPVDQWSKVWMRWHNSPENRTTRSMLFLAFQVDFLFVLTVSYATTINEKHRVHAPQSSFRESNLKSQFCGVFFSLYFFSQ